MAQLVVNKSDLWLVNAQVVQPKADSVILTLQANVDLKLALPVRIEPVTLYLFEREYGHDNPYAAVNIPGSNIKGNYTLGVSDQFTPIQNQTVWEKFVKQVVFQEKTSLAMYGKMTAYLGVLKSHVTMDKDVVAPSKSCLSTLHQLNPPHSIYFLYYPLCELLLTPSSLK